METILNMITKYGIGLVCVAYLIYFQNTTMKGLLDEFKIVSHRLTKIETKLNIDSEVEDE